MTEEVKNMKLLIKQNEIEFVENFKKKMGATVKLLLLLIQLFSRNFVELVPHRTVPYQTQTFY